MELGTVVVTGASTGIGEATVLHLKGLGFEPLAGVRRDEDAERLRDQGVEPLALDVTDAASKTPIWKKGDAAAAEMPRNVPEEAQRLYGGLADALRAETRKVEQERGLPPLAVAEVIGTALTARRPKTRYLVGRDARIRAAIAKRLPDRAMDALIARALSGGYRRILRRELRPSRPASGRP